MVTYSIRRISSLEPHPTKHLSYLSHSHAVRCQGGWNLPKWLIRRRTNTTSRWGTIRSLRQWNTAGKTPNIRWNYGASHRKIRISSGDLFQQSMFYQKVVGIGRITCYWQQMWLLMEIQPPLNGVSWIKYGGWTISNADRMGMRLVQYITIYNHIYPYIYIHI